ncbi:MAG: hypothetical protein ACJAS1_005291 [Oleiphilaceae bacterium]|jgi:hypothetical protein|tara:strand:+ start:648 stop:1079 length:432 start_codon:yes stop_codon:yes gene_type:complete
MKGFQLMHKLILLTGLVLLTSCASNTSIVANQSTSHSNPICLISGVPSSDIKYTVITQLKYAKNGYGNINSVLPIIVKQAQSLGADAIIDYNGGHRFGFWPWQFIRPVVRGTAVTWDSPNDIDCKALGGTFDTQLKGSLTTDV